MIISRTRITLTSTLVKCSASRPTFQRTESRSVLVLDIVPSLIEDWMPKCQPNQFELATLPLLQAQLAQIPCWSVKSVSTGTNPRPYYIPIIIYHSRVIETQNTWHRAPRVPGLVSEPESQGAEDKQDLGSGQHHGRVRVVRRHGEALPPPPRHHHQTVRDRRVCGALASRWGGGIVYASLDFLMRIFVDFDQIKFKLKNYHPFKQQ